MAEVVANGVRLHVQRRSAGPDQAAAAVVFVHGLGADNLTSLYYALGAAVGVTGAELIFYDLRGHGRSERPPSGYGLSGSVADLAALLDALGVDGPVHLVGSSYGGTVALALAVDQPELVASVVLVDAPLPIEGRDNPLTRNLARYTRIFDDQGVRVAIEGLPRNQAMLARQARALLQETTFRDDLLAIEPFRTGELRSLRCPVLAVYGASSDLVEVAPELEHLLPDCTVEILPGASHFLLREATGELRRLVPAWLAAHDRRLRAPERAVRS